MTGRRALTYQVASLSAKLGRPIDDQRCGLWVYRRELRRRRLRVDYVNVQLLVNAIARLRLAAKTTAYRHAPAAGGELPAR